MEIEDGRLLAYAKRMMSTASLRVWPSSSDVVCKSEQRGYLRLTHGHKYEFTRDQTHKAVDPGPVDCYFFSFLACGAFNNDNSFHL